MSQFNNPKLDFYFRVISMSMRHTANVRMQKYDVTAPQARLLGIIDNELNAGRTVSRRGLQEMTMVTGPAVTNIINGLEKRGFITRTTGRDDARTMEITITKKGRKLLSDMNEVFDGIETELVKRFSEEEQKQFREYLVRAMKNVEVDHL